MQMIRKGCLVERNIEGTWFSAVVIDVYLSEDVATVQYYDDSNVELEVPLDELRLSENKNKNLTKTKESTQLAKPLAGLIEDDSEQRKNHKTKVFFHDTTNTDEAIIMNGADNKLAAGGGLRALRYLKK